MLLQVHLLFFLNLLHTVCSLEYMLLGFLLAFFTLILFFMQNYLFVMKFNIKLKMASFNPVGKEKNIIDLCRTKTFIIFQYKNNNYDVYFTSSSYKLVEYTFEKNGDNFKIITEYSNLKVIYYVYLNKVINWDNILKSDSNIFPKPIVITKKTNDKCIENNPNNFSIEKVSIHFPTTLGANGINKVSLITKQQYAVLKSLFISESENKINNKAINIDDIHIKLFYHPTHCKEDNIYGVVFEAKSNAAVKEKRYRFRIPT